MVKTNPVPPKPIWVYAYQLVPPQLADRLATVQPLLSDEQLDARRGGRTWAGRVVTEERVTHVLIVSDSPEPDQEGNRNLESELKELKAEFTVSPPVVLS
jgi:hypothetical protein